MGGCQEGEAVQTDSPKPEHECSGGVQEFPWDVGRKYEHVFTYLSQPFYLFFFAFLGHLWHMEVPSLGV